MEKAVRRRELLYKWILYGLLMFIALFMVTQDAKAAVTGKIAGVVLDAGTGEPLPGANVLIEGTDRGAACDADGYYYILRLDPGTYDVQARIIGYESVTKTGVKVESGHTTPLNFELRETIVEGEGVIVQAEREVVKMDLAGSSFSAERADIEAVPLISDVTQYLSLQAGIDGWSVRGGGIDQTKLMADGLLLVDNLSNEPVMMPNLSEIKEISLVKGGFNAEYANVRSGVVNVVTREGSAKEYQGSFEFRYTPGYQKHSGQSIFDPDNYNNAVFFWNKLDTGYVWDIDGDDTLSCDTIIKYDSICWKGTGSVWSNRRSPFYDTIKAKSYPSFRGWELEARADADIITPEEYRDMFIWLRRIDTEGDTSLPGWDELMPDSAYAPIYEISLEGDTTITGYTKFPWQPEEGEEWPAKYGNKPDWTLDAGFGGPIPVIGQHLGNMSFYASYRDHNEAFAIPDSRDYYRERMASLKLTSRFGNFKLNLRGAYSIVNSLSPWASGYQMGHADYFYGYNGQIYLRSGMDIIDPTGEWNGLNHGSDKLSVGNLYRANALSPFDVTSRMYGLSLQHALSENTFYDVKIVYLRTENNARFYYDVPRRMMGDTVVRWFGNMVIGGGEYAVDNIPYGFADPDYEAGVISDIGGANYGSTHQLGTWNTSWSETYNASFDMTSQLNKINQIKFGFSVQYDKLHEYWIATDGWTWADPGEETTWSGQQYIYTNYDQSPILAGGYIQDKIEFEGMFANFGLRFDYSDPNTEWPTTEDRYSLFYSAYMKDSLMAQMPMEDASAAFKLSPRLGISFPILERSKLFFNYGHFYSLPPNAYRYKIIWGDYRSPIIFLGNPSLDMERTISYEVGFESSIANTYLARVSGYYKDTDNEYANVTYTDYYGDVNYITVENTGYGDTRGFEFEFRKAQGRFFTGWINYDYRVQTSGQIGRDAYYEDLVMNQTEGKVMPEEDNPIPRPVFRTQVTLKLPQDWGIFLGGYDFSLLYSWRAGWYDTYMGDYGEEMRNELRNNIRWQDERNVDISLRKSFVVAGAPVSLFFDVHNVFDWGTLSTQAFSDGFDRNDYIRSLHLETFNEEPWLADPYRNGPAEGEEPDRIGDLRSEEKPYIDNPDREFLWYLNPRYMQFGIRFSF